jgi:hypothetical protein
MLGIKNDRPEDDLRGDIKKSLGPDLPRRQKSSANLMTEPFQIMVGAKGFEPPTSWSQTKLLARRYAKSRVYVPEWTSPWASKVDVGGGIKLVV